MKILLLSIVLSVINFANTQVMVNSSTQLSTYNHRLSLAMKKQAQLRNLAKVSQDEVRKIANNICKEEVNSLRLTHKGQLLFYRVYTENCRLEINALDAAIISQLLRKKT